MDFYNSETNGAIFCIAGPRGGRDGGVPGRPAGGGVGLHRSHPGGPGGGLSPRPRLPPREVLGLGGKGAGLFLIFEYSRKNATSVTIIFWVIYDTYNPNVYDQRGHSPSFWQFSFFCDTRWDMWGCFLHSMCMLHLIGSTQSRALFFFTPLYIFSIMNNNILYTLYHHYYYIIIIIYSSPDLSFFTAPKLDLHFSDRPTI